MGDFMADLNNRAGSVKKGTYHVNGQTGKVIGTTPVSRGKVLSYAASVLAAVTAACYMVVWVLEIL